MRRSHLLVAASIAAALCACERAEAPAPAAGASPEVAAPSETEAASVEPSEPVVIPPFDPSLPSLEIARAPSPTPQIAGAAAAKPRVPKREGATTTAAASPLHPPLDALLHAPYALPNASSSIDLGPGAAQRVEPKPPRALDTLGPSIRLERRGESIGPSGPRQGTYWETDAGVRVPVDKTVSLEGGVRVDSREEPGVKEQEQRRPTPRVGVEVKF